MIEFIVGQKELQVKQNGYLFINHRSSSPFLTAGVGNASYDMFHGNFDIEDHVFEKVRLNDFNILEQKKDYLQVSFSKAGLYEIITNFLVVDGRLEVRFDAKEATNRLWVNIAADRKEHIYGCGEQFSELDLRGKKVPLWVSEQGVGRNKNDIITFFANQHDKAGGDWYTTYYPQPTFVSTNHYFCHVVDSSYMAFDFRNDDFHQLEIWSVPEKIVLSKQNSALEVLENLTELQGRQPELPEWVYKGVWLGLQGGTKTVLSKLKNAQDKGLKVSGIWAQDWEGRRITSFGKQLMWDWIWNKNHYPDLDKVIPKLKEDGVRFLGYINPFLALEGKLYKEASEKNYLVMNQTGEEYHVEITTFPAAMLDLTNPEACEWIKNVIKKNMIEFGLSGWMCDFGEYLPTDAVLHSGENAETYHNRLPADWARLNREAIEEAGMLKEVSFFTRAGYTGTTRYSTMMWAGDQLVNWSLDDGLASCIPAAISLGMTGFGLFHSDIGGYTSLYNVIRSKELFMRWAEMGAFASLMRTHEGNRPDENWQFDSDEETLLHFVKMSKIYTHLKPYIKELVKENADRGIPVMRHPFIHYENDEKLHSMKYQYLFGRDIMVAPVYEAEKTEWTVYLPDDQWIHVWSGEEYSKGGYTVKAPLGEPPVFYRKKSPFKKLFGELKNIK